MLGKINRAPYFVKQTRGSELGYQILDYKKEEFPDSTPSFDGYKLALSPERESYEFRVENGEGEILPGSQRGVHIVRKEGAKFLYIVSIFPLLVGLFLFIQRKISTA